MAEELVSIDYSKIRLYMILFITMIVAGGIAYLGIQLKKQQPVFVNSTTGKVSNVTCLSNVCSANLMVDVSGTMYNTTLTYSNVVGGIAQDATLPVYFSSDTPPKFNSQKDVSLPTFIAPSLITLAAFMAIIAILSLFSIFSGGESISMNYRGGALPR